MSVHKSIRTMIQGINNLTIPDSSIYYGTRNQFGSYPAITYLLSDHETATIGSNPIRRCNVMIKSVELTAEAALDLSEAVESALVAGTYGDYILCSVLNKNTILEEPTSSNGEETNPFVATTSAQIYYKEDLS